jgi:predicted amidohydrolase YtcJ
MKNRMVVLLFGLLMTLLLVSLPLMTSCDKGLSPANIPEEQAADLVIYNGKVVTVDKSFSIAQAVAVKGDKIIAVGTDEEIEALVGKNTKVLNLKGKTMLPGINDTHVHSTLFGSEKPPLVIDLTDPKLNSIAAIVKAVGERAKTTKAGEWIMGMGLYLNALEEYKKDSTRLPTRWDLDAVSPNNPVCLTVGYFSFFPPTNWLNSKALELVGITKNTPVAPDDEIIKDPATGELTGLVMGMVTNSMVKEALPAFTLEDKKQAALSAMRELNALGITSITDGAMGPGTRGYYQGIWDDECIRAYNDLYNEGKMTMRVGIMAVFTPYNTCDVELIKEGLASYKDTTPNNEWLRIAGTKFFADGNPMMQTSWNYAPYPDGSYGTLNSPGNTDEERIQSLTDIIAYAHNLGWRVGIHAIGDRASDVAADAFIKAEQDNPKGLRHYVIHGGSISVKKAKSMAECNVGMSTQTGMMLDLMRFFTGGDTSGGQGMPMGSMASPLKGLIDRGVHVSASSDVPCAGPDWRLGIQGAISDKLTMEQAIRMYTIEGAWLDHMEDIKGSIEVGKLADFCILDKDILTVDIGVIQNLMTIVGGKIVYDAGEL